MLAIAAATTTGSSCSAATRRRARRREDRNPPTTPHSGRWPRHRRLGLTIAGATFCLSFARLPYFTTMGAPVAIGMVVVVLISVTLGPAVLFLGSKIGRYESKKASRPRFWRRVGTAVVRWPHRFS